METLLSLRQKSKTGIVDLTTGIFDQVFAGKSRNFYTLVLADHQQYRQQGKAHLAKVWKEYELAAKTFADSNADQPSFNSLILARVQYPAASDVFARLGVQGLPFAAIIPPTLPIKEGALVKIPAENVMSADNYPWTAEAFGTFIAEQTGLKFGEVLRPQSFAKRMAPLLGLALLAFMAFGVRVAYSLAFLRNSALYSSGALFVWWFAVSGGMHNIIRQVPMLGYDPRTRSAIVFLPGQGQFGMEGFIMGTLYISIGLIAMAAVTLLPSIENKKTRTKAAYTLLGIGALNFRLISAGHLWKTHLEVYWYLPGSILWLASGAFMIGFWAMNHTGKKI